MTNSHFMSPTKKHLSVKERRQQLILAADTILKQEGVVDFTIDKVVDYLGVAKGTFYKYFKSKDDILAEVCAKALNQLHNYFKLSERSQPGSIESTRAIIHSSYEYSKDYPEYFELIVHMERPELDYDATAHKEASMQIQNFFMGHIQKQKDNGIIRKDVSPLLANYFCWGSSMGIMQFLDAKKAFLEETVAVTQRELLEAFVDVLIHGMKT